MLRSLAAFRSPIPFSNPSVLVGIFLSEGSISISLIFFVNKSLFFHQMLLGALTLYGHAIRENSLWFIFGVDESHRFEASHHAGLVCFFLLPGGLWFIVFQDYAESAVAVPVPRILVVAWNNKWKTLFHPLGVVSPVANPKVIARHRVECFCPPIFSM
ncbi:hypothetical protein HDV57DRAFT_498618 [Trichoderma longibrachiatum]